MDERVQSQVQPSPSPSASDTSELLRGIGFIWLLNLVHLGLAYIAMPVGAVLIMAFGVVQLAYVIPLAIKAKRSGDRGRMKGMIIAASVTFLLSVACWGVVVGSLGDMH